MSSTKIKLKTGPISGFASQLGTGSREPVWSNNADGYNRLFITNGTASSPTLVNPVVKHNIRNTSGFPWNSVSVKQEDGYVDYPLLTSSNSSDKNISQNTVSSYEFSTNSITVNLGSSVGSAWASYTIRVISSSTVSTSTGTNINQENSFIISTPPSGYSSISDIYTAVNTGTVFVEISITTTANRTFTFPVTIGDHDASTYEDNYAEGNISSTKPGYGSMGVSFSQSVMHRCRILLTGTSYFYNTDDNVYELPDSRTSSSSVVNKAENNIITGSDDSLGTITFRFPINSITRPSYSEITLFPPVSTMFTKNPTSVCCRLPFRSGQIPVLSQGSVNSGKYVALADEGCGIYKMETPASGTTKMLTCTNTTGSISFSWNELPSSGIIEITHSALLTLISQGNLVKGNLYRITDYVTTTSYTNTSSAHHQFDLIVLATSESTLHCRAMAEKHVYVPGEISENYFNSQDLSKWEVWYDVNNDAAKYAWADTTNGKGVIYRLIDEYKNDCPYDFKNILFTITGQQADAFTFNLYTDNACTDYSLRGAEKCRANIIKPLDSRGTLHPNKIVFYNTDNTVICSRNTFGENCKSITFGSGCKNNTFGIGCEEITLGSENTSNSFGDGCSNITFGNSSNPSAGGSYCRYIDIESDNKYIRIYNTGTANLNNQLQNITILSGCSGASASSYNEISGISRANSYRTHVGRDSSSNIKVWNIADMFLPNSI